VNVAGFVTNNWSDTYNWNITEGSRVYIPTVGWISDNEVQKLEECKGLKFSISIRSGFHL